MNTFCDWLLLCKAPALTAQAKKIAGVTTFVRYVTTQNRYQCYIVRLRIMLQVYNSSLSRSSTLFEVEKSRLHRHGRSSFIVYPFSLITNPTSKATFVRSMIKSIFQHDNKLIAPIVAQQWSQWNGMTDEWWLRSIWQQHVTICLECHESNWPSRCQKWPQHKKNQQKHRRQNCAN